MAFSAFNFAGSVMGKKIQVPKLPPPVIQNPNFANNLADTKQSFASSTDFIQGWTIVLDSVNPIPISNYRLFNNFREGTDSTENSIPNNSRTYPTINRAVVTTAVFCQIKNMITSSCVKQNITFNQVRLYTFSFYATPRKTLYNTSNTISLIVGTETVITTSLTANSNFEQFSGTYTPPSVGTYELKIEWKNTASNDSSITVTGVSVV